ncbi:MAG: DUF1998 domain-containing protein [Myxococcales bacterium]|nr:DUF1998 domain-containing protein [Myxococcales bacterium]
MSTKRKRIPPVGQLRQSQVVTTFGPGAMVDLPEHAVLIGGLDDWHGDRKQISEERLEERVAELLNADRVKLFAPPVDDGEPNSPSANIPAIQFPAWFLGQVYATYTDETGREYRTRPMVRWSQLRKGRYYDEERKLRQVVPVRFVRACVRGHLSDVDWYAFVHRDFESPQVGQLWFDEGGAGHDFRDIYVRLATTATAHGVRRPLSDATVPDGMQLGMCNGKQPWLGPSVKEPCDKPSRLLNRSASNAYFAQKLGVISIPDLDAPLQLAVDRVYEDFLRFAEGPHDIAHDRKKDKVFYALEGHSDDVVWAEVQRRKKGPGRKERKGIKQAEIETLLAAPFTVGEDHPDGDYYARARDPGRIPDVLRDRITGVVLVHKLREVVAQVGFTRFEAAMPDVDGELSLRVELAPLSRQPSWVPANENRGEGVFVAFSDQAIANWLDEQKNPGIARRKEELLAGFDAWKQRKGIEGATFPGLPYIMLHSLAHLLITAVALECGYSASAIRERVYAGDSGHGILLYTGGAGTEGTLGGLVEVGRHIERHLAQALEMGRLCSNDPVCAQHDPTNPYEERFLHGAACHGCLLVAETSCERRNELLDRSLVVPTVGTPDAAFFPDVDVIRDALLGRTAGADVGKHVGPAPIAPAPAGPPPAMEVERTASGTVAAPAPPPDVRPLSDAPPLPVARTLAELAGVDVGSSGEFLLVVDAADAPDRRSATYRCEPLAESPADIREGTLVLVVHEALTRGSRRLGAGVGKWIRRTMVDAKTGEPREKIVLRGPIPPPELDVSSDELAAMRGLARLTRIEG